jgi:N6-L-threonylcarbamoyladenine synthase
MLILGIETSCDETAVSLIDVKEEQGRKLFKVLQNAVLSQVSLHAQYGGVFPMMAKREHAKNLPKLIQSVLSEANILIKKESNIDEEKAKQVKDLVGEKESILYQSLLEESSIWNTDNFSQKIEAITVTSGPGLEPALWVGINCARALSHLWQAKIVPTNHMEGHIISSLFDTGSMSDFTELKDIEFKALAILISGGHTELVEIDSFSTYKVIGKTRDDAIGEAFDKVARLLHLPYPGGSELSKLAQIERIKHPEKRTNYSLPRPMINSHDYDFSFSGIKTAVLYMTKKIEDLNEDIKCQIAREFEDAVTEVLIKKVTDVILNSEIKTLIIGGGVIANNHIRKEFENLSQKYNISLLLPTKELSTDNALMIALAGSINFINNKDRYKISTETDIKANGNMTF